MFRFVILFGHCYGREVLTLLLLLNGCGSGPEPGSEPEPVSSPSVLLVILDTVRGDAVSAEVTPVLSRLAGLGVMYNDAHTSGTWSWPSHASMFLGVAPWEHGAHFDPNGVQVAGGDPTTVSLPRSDIPTLAERFGDAGYQTVLATANPWLKDGLGLSRGYEVIRYSAKDADVISHVRAGLQASGSRPLFLTVNLMTAHAPFSVETDCPWLAPHRATIDGPELAPYRGPAGLTMTRGPTFHDIGAFAYARGELSLSEEALSAFRAAYRCDVRRADARLGEVLQLWAQGNRGGIIAVTSDHGELLGEHRQWEHGRGVWPELSHVPLVIAAPGALKAGSVVTEPVLLHGLYGSLLSLAGLAKPADKPLESGPRRIKAWSDTMWATHVGGRFAHDATAYVEGGWARVAWGDEEYFFNATVDPYFRSPVPAPPSASALRSAASTAFVDAIPQGGAPVMDEETQRMMEELGYLAPHKD